MFEIGPSLREARTRRDLDFPELEIRTKIRAKYLRLLEEEQFAQLPAATYVKGFLRTYADALGLDGQLYVDEYNSRFVVGDDEARPAIRRSTAAGQRSRARRRERRESRIVVLALAVIAIVTALVIAAWKFGGSNAPPVRGLSPAAPAKTVRATTVVVRATRGAAYLDVRLGTRGGAPLFQGTLARHQIQRFTQRSLWLHVTAPRNVVVTVRGQRVTVPRGGTLQISAGG